MEVLNLDPRDTVGTMLDGDRLFSAISVGRSDRNGRRTQLYSSNGKTATNCSSQTLGP